MCRLNVHVVYSNGISVASRDQVNVSYIFHFKLMVSCESIHIGQVVSTINGNVLQASCSK